jgi:hypothetical protein
MSGIYCFNTLYNLNLHTSLILTHVNNILNVFAFFGDAGVTYLVKCRKYPLSVQKETTEHEFDRKKSVTDIQLDAIMDVRGIYCLYFQQKVGKKFFSLYHTHTKCQKFTDLIRFII